MGVDVNLAGRARRLVNLLADRDFGVVPWQPAYLLVVPAVLLSAFRQKGAPGPAQLPESVVVGVPLAAGWLTATFMALTMQGWWWPGRQLVVVLPCAALAVLALAARSRPARRALVGLGAAGVVTFLWLAVEGLDRRLTWVVDFTTTTNPLYRAWRLLLPDGRSTSDGELAITAVCAAAIVALAIWSWRRRPARAVAVLAAVALAAAVAGYADDGAAVRGVGSPATRS
jgi:hypothetical protein